MELKHIFNELHYELVRTIAEGGMGVVYEARQIGLGGFKKVVAIKLIKEEFSAIEEFKNNFIGEAKLVADLIHTNIVQMYHLGQIGEQYFMTMEFVNGWNLDDFLIKHRVTNQAIPIDLAVFIVSRITRGLAYAHDKADLYGNNLGIVHRDINPKNVMIAQEGDVKITDFGIAKAFEADSTGELKDLMYNEEGYSIAGKDEYLSPEQARCEVTDNRADLFACGIIMAELILGKNIFEGDTSEETIKLIQDKEIPDFTQLRPDLDESLNTILQNALQRDRDARYQTAQQMLGHLEYYIYGGGYGPTNEKLALYMKDVMGDDGANAAARWAAGQTPGL
jgi:serine/threonine-protein kinase